MVDIFYDSDSLPVDLDQMPKISTKHHQNPSKKDPQKQSWGSGSSSKTFLNSSLTKFFKSIALPAAVPVAVLLPPAPWGGAVGAVGAARRGRGGRAAGAGAEASGGGP